MRRLPTALAVLCLTGLWLTGAAAHAQTPASDKYAPPHLLKYWRSHGPGSTLGTSSSETAPGVYPATPAMAPEMMNAVSRMRNTGKPSARRAARCRAPPPAHGRTASAPAW